MPTPTGLTTATKREPAPNSPYYGLQSATWGNVRRALRRLGAAPERVTSKHASVLYRMPTGTKIACGRDVRDEVHVRGNLAQLFEELDRADCPAMLFVAVLSHIGCAWVPGGPPDDVRRLGQYLLHDRPNLSRKDEWTDAMRNFHMRTKRDNARDDTIAETPVTPPAAPAPVAAAPAPAAAPTPTESSPANLTTTDVLALTDLTGDARIRAGQRIAKAVARPAPWLKPLLASGDVVARQQRHGQSTRNAYFFTERAAMSVAERLAGKPIRKRSAPQPAEPKPTAQPAPTPPRVAPSSRPDGLWTMTMLMDLAGLTGDERVKAVTRLGTAIKNSESLASPWLKSGDITFDTDRHKPGSQHKRYLFTERAALGLAEELLRRYAPDRLEPVAVAGAGDLDPVQLDSPAQEPTVPAATPEPASDPAPGFAVVGVRTVTEAGPTPPRPYIVPDSLQALFERVEQDLRRDPDGRPIGDLADAAIDALRRLVGPRPGDAPVFLPVGVNVAPPTATPPRPKPSPLRAMEPPFAADEIGPAALLVCERLGIPVPFTKDGLTIDIEAITGRLEARDIILAVANAPA